jgi:hypothetical protein
MSDDFSGHFPNKESGGGGATKGRAPAAPTQGEIDAAFAQWWAHYPRKEAKFAAKKAYVAIVTGKHRDPEAHCIHTGSAGTPTSSAVKSGRPPQPSDSG